MNFLYLKNRKELDDFISKQHSCQFLQSWDWADFQESIGNKVYRVGVEEDSKLIASAMVIEKNIFNFKYFYCPRGPIISNEQALDFIFEKIKYLAKQSGAKFLRFEPLLGWQKKDLPIVKTIDIQPSQTIILDLNKTEDELLSAMHQKTRYNIRLAEKKGVEIFQPDGQWNEIWKIMQATKARDGFSLHDELYYKAMVEKTVKVFAARYEGKIIAIALVIFNNNCVTYLHGGSTNEYRNVMAPYLLQWSIIKQAKNSGFTHYDFNGIDENKWPGVTRFKKGFADKIIDYSGTFDLIFSPVYYIVYKVIRKLRRLF